LIGEAPGQTVESDIANERYIVTNAPGGDPQITATFGETQKNLAATTKIPIKHPKVVSLAKEAVFGADTRPLFSKLTSGGSKAKAFQKAEKTLRWQIFEKPHYTSRLS